MRKCLFISATNTDVGKSYASEKFLRYYAKKGFKVGYFKPIETGVIDYPIDGKKLLKIAQELNPDFKVTIDDVVPYQFKLAAAPFVAKESSKIDIDFIKQKRDYLLGFCDILICEGAGGLMVPIGLDYFIIDLIKDLECDCVLITPSKLGCINDTILSIQALKNKKIDFDFYINLYEDKDSFSKVSLPFLEKYFQNLNFLDDL